MYFCTRRSQFTSRKPAHQLWPGGGLGGFGAGRSLGSSQSQGLQLSAHLFGCWGWEDWEGQADGYFFCGSPNQKKRTERKHMKFP